MLNALAIYDATTYDRIKSAEKNKMTLFESSSLSYVAKKILPTMHFSIKDYATEMQTNEGLYYYIGKQPNDTFLMVICCERPLKKEEVAHLFVNMRHAHLRPNVVKLDDMIANPFAYISKDKYIDKTQSNIDEVKAIMLYNIDKMLARHDKLEELSKGTFQLQEQSLKFKKATVELNKPCCRYM